MKSTQLLLFVKYPYSAAVLACVWIGSMIMVFINRDLPVVAIVAINAVVSWIVTWSSLNSRERER
jgi:hypothetical protein